MVPCATRFSTATLCATSLLSQWASATLARCLWQWTHPPATRPPDSPQRRAQTARLPFRTVTFCKCFFSTQCVNTPPRPATHRTEAAAALRKTQHILGLCHRCAFGQRSDSQQLLRNLGLPPRRAMDRSAADIQDVTVEEGLEPPLPTDPGWHLLEDKRGVKAMEGVRRCKNNWTPWPSRADGGAYEASPCPRWTALAVRCRRRSTAIGHEVRFPSINDEGHDHEAQLEDATRPSAGRRAVSRRCRRSGHALQGAV